MPRPNVGSMLLLMFQVVVMFHVLGDEIHAWVCNHPIEERARLIIGIWLLLGLLIDWHMGLLPRLLSHIMPPLNIKILYSVLAVFVEAGTVPSGVMLMVRVLNQHREAAGGEMEPVLGMGRDVWHVLIKLNGCLYPAAVLLCFKLRDVWERAFGDHAWDVQGGGEW